MKRILVTGSNGQLGRTLKELTSSYPDLNVHFLPKSKMDITQGDEVMRMFNEIKPHYCINCAAYNQVDQAEKDTENAFDVNVNGVKHLVDASKVHNTVLIHISTDYVFDGTAEDGYSPGDIPNPINVYGHSKWEGEKAIQEGLERYFIVRTSWLYSPKYGKNFYKTIVHKAAEGESLRVTDQQLGCPTHTETLSRFLLDLVAVNNTDFGIKHVTDGEAMTWFDFAKRILASEGYEGKISLEKGEYIQRGDNSRTFARRPKVSILKPN